VWTNAEGDLQSKWNAEPTNVDDVYVLTWNVGNIVKDSAVPVVLKNLAPST